MLGGRVRLVQKHAARMVAQPPRNGVVGQAGDRVRRRPEKFSCT